jgi:asparagine synthase (glutamine-hydrolysing)
MCGIVGFTWDDEKLAKKMADLIISRGPDDSGSYHDKNVSLGHRRLSIIDLSQKGRQPLFNENGDVLVIFNGEIYNYKELRNELEQKGHKFSTETDTEVLVHGYEAWGEKLPERLNGIFAFCIYDRTKKKLFFARDHLGVKPLYYHDDGKDLVFGSEIKALLLAGIPREVDTTALHEYLSFRYVPGPRTMFRNIIKLLPGHSMTYDLKTRSKKMRQFWKLSLNPDSQAKPEGSYVQELLAQLRKSVQMQLMSDVPLGVFLSGGIDSASMVGLMHEQGVEDIKTFSIGFDNYTDKAEEMKNARLVSDYFSTDHHEFIVGPEAMDNLPAVVWHLDEPVGVDTSVPTFLLSKFTKPHVTVTLSGEGGDEAFGGYVQYNTLNIGEKLLKPIPKIVRSSIIAPAVSITPVSLLTRFFRYPGSIGREGRERFVALVKEIDDRAQSYMNLVSIFSDKEKQSLCGDTLGEVADKHNLVAEVRKNYFSNKVPLGDQIFLRENTTFLPDFVLSRLDKMTMAFGLESRVPLLDKNFVGLVSRIPRPLKKNKFVFRQAMKNILPKKVVARRKSPFFFPLENWYSKGLRQMASRALSPKEEAMKQYFRPEAIRRLLEKSSSSMPHSRQLWVLTNFALWHKLYIERDVKKSPNSFDTLY